MSDHVRSSFTGFAPGDHVTRCRAKLRSHLRGYLTPISDFAELGYADPRKGARCWATRPRARAAWQELNTQSQRAGFESAPDLRHPDPPPAARRTGSPRSPTCAVLGHFEGMSDNLRIEIVGSGFV